MTESTAPAPVATTPAGSGFVIPEKSPEGQSLTAREQYQHMLKNPAWARDALENGTQARQQYDDLMRRQAQELDAAEQGPATVTDPSAYRLGIDVSAGREAEGFDGQVRAWLHEAQAPAEIGASLAGHVSDLARKYSGASDPDRARHAQDSRATLERIYGAELEQKLDLAADFLNGIGAKHPEFVGFLESNQYIAADSMVLAQVIRLAEAAHARGRGG